MRMLSDKKNMSVIHNILLCTSSFFVCVGTFDMHGTFIRGKGNTKHPNEWKYKAYPYEKRMHPPIWVFKRRRFDKVVLESKECLEVLVKAVYIWPK